MLGLSCTLLTFLAAQSAEAPADVIELKSRTFTFPIVWDEKRSAELQKARLFVSDDKGASWRTVSDHKPGETKAPFKAERDGELWFALQLQMKSGQFEPTTPERLSPTFKVRVVTAKVEPKQATESISKSAPAATLAETMERKGYVPIELVKMRTGYLGVKIKVGERTLNMLLDTGAPNTHFDPERTKALELAWRHFDEAAFGPGWGKIGYGELPGMKIGAVDVGAVSVRSQDKSKLNEQLVAYGDAPIDGLLGADVLEPHEAVIDYATRTLYLRPIAKR
jgi:hypothetical protein